MATTNETIQIGPEAGPDYLAKRRLPDGRLLVVMPLLFNRARLGLSPVGFDDSGFNDVW